MHARANSSESQHERAVAAALRRTERNRPVDEDALMVLLAEQVAIPLDQLARFLDRSLEATVRALAALEAAGYLSHRRFLVRDYPWFWPTRAGLGRSGTGFPHREPDVAGLAHRRAVNEVRLHLAAKAPRGRWVCERIVWRRRDPADHLPDAVLEIDGERHAIEAELSRKENLDIRRIVAEHSNRYDAVLYFCGPYPYLLLKRVQAEGRWPKLVVRRVPQGEEPC